MNITVNDVSLPLPAPVTFETAPLSPGRIVRSLTGAYLGTEGKSGKTRLTISWKGLDGGNMSLLAGDTLRLTCPCPASGAEETHDYLVRARQISLTRDDPLRGDVKLILEEV